MNTPRPTSWNLPNALTVLRTLLVPLLGWMLIAHPDQPGWRLATTGLFLAAMLTDLIDGHLARKYDLITSFGKLMDPIADKAMTGMALIGLSVTGELPWWITVIILVREWGITLMRFVVIRYGVISANRGGKTKTVLQTVAIVLFLLPLPSLGSPFSLVMVPDAIGWIAMIGALILTVLTGLDYLREAWKLVRSTDRDRDLA
ncbi:CDP-diacylglycerol--glycerol-3-phosphate 3-phosphatidyltransferase [Naumannella halotolerans]|uniref:CDP-diacylglycerol--glycerol-3-phosphate 3-phosphatidyltransferase n=1 Tax=Naumannella halotolerans TaxID=993414 RepID=A0A4R7J8Q1_9ACTN|nr:CDP-diacylglycerol--glycerol-3-phosphate 3-phosphatidyltransferase [Naumannella halotolerans]TDT33176.1 CDP-diacylglycerol--glycerol-3-phosphate 3-phosphatidyltransferase [Naumannella halotolerans]